MATRAGAMRRQAGRKGARRAPGDAARASLATPPALPEAESRRAARAYQRRVALLALSLGLFVLIAAGAAIRRDRAALPARDPAQASAAPRCEDGTDRVAVVAQSPNGPEVSRDAPIVVTFSCPVDQQAVERAFVLYPVTPGRFTWQGTTLHFQPSEPLRPQTRYRVTLFGGLRDSRGFVDGRKVSWPFLTRAEP